jgi:MATE family multidrug resistance protein
MTDGPAPPRLSTLLSLAWPIVISRSSQVVVGFSDAVMVGSLGEAELAATTTGAFNAFFLFILPMGTVFIVSSFSSQLFGRGELRSARRYGYYGLILALAAEEDSLDKVLTKDKHDVIRYNYNKQDETKNARSY